MRNKFAPLDRNKIKDLVKRALAEDKVFEDITSRALIGLAANVRCKIVFKEAGMLCGIDFAREIFLAMDGKITFKKLKENGEFIAKNEVVAEIEGQARAVLSAERTALNFLGHLSGIATLTDKFVAAAVKSKIAITDTRKTLPLLREVEKYAVRVGGGVSHRMDLAERFLVKDNHLDILKKTGEKNPIEFAVLEIKKHSSKVLEIEVDNLKDFGQALELKPDIIMLDNMNMRQIKQALLLRDKINPSMKIEVSGGMTIAKIKKLSALKIDYISIGMLTHSPKSIDIGLEVC